jgi:hypothetical protein
VDESRKPPLQFANRVIRRFVDNQLGDEALVLPDDYLKIRLVFRRCRGSWEQVTQGNVVHIHLLSKVVSAWGRLKGKQREVEV